MTDTGTRPYESPRVTDLGSISDHTFIVGDVICKILPILCGGSSNPPGGGSPSTGFSN